MLYIIWLNVGGAMHFITVAKSKMYGFMTDLLLNINYITFLT